MERRRRLTHARKELEAVPEFEYVVVNDDLERAYGQVEAVVRAEWARAHRIPGLEAHARRLITGLDELIRHGL